MTEFELPTKADELISLADKVKCAILPKDVSESFRKAALLEIYALAVSRARTTNDTASAQRAQKEAAALFVGTGRSLGIWNYKTPGKPEEGECKAKIASGATCEWTVDFHDGHDKAYVIIQEKPVRRLLGLSETGRKNLLVKLHRLVF